MAVAETDVAKVGLSIFSLEGMMRAELTIVLTVLSLAAGSASWGAGYEAISPKARKPVEKKQASEPEAQAPKQLPFHPETASANPCPNETGWLLSTMPLTTTEKSGDNP